MTRPPYPAPYWDRLTPAQRVNDLVHKIAQRTGMGYARAYALAASIVDAPGQPGETYAARLDRAGRLPKAIAALIEYHGRLECQTEPQ